MYYVIEIEYVGPNRDQAKYVDSRTVEIRDEPALYNMSQEPCLKGWCGTTDDWAMYAYGEYDTLKEAQACARHNFGHLRSFDYEGDNPHVVEVYKPGKYVPMSKEQTEDWVWEAAHADIDADTTDKQISKLVEKYEEQANEEGYRLHDALADMLKEHRQDKQEALDLA